MPSISVNPVRMGNDLVTRYEDNATTALQTFTFPSVQETTAIFNQGVRTLSVIALGKAYSVQPNTSVHITDNIDSFQIKADQGSQPFRVEGRTDFEGKSTVSSVNLFDKSKTVADSMVSAAGAIIASVGNTASDFIPVTPGTTYTAKYCYVIAYYDINKTFISRTVNSTSTANYQFTPPANAYFVKIVVSTTNIDAQMLVLGTVLPTFFIPQGAVVSTSFVFSSRIIDDAQTVPKNKWSGKKWSGLGDSITFLERWQPFVKDALGLSFTNYGVSGTKVADSTGTDTTAMCRDERINLIDATSDIVSVMGGVNDWANNVPLGAITDTVTTSYYGALNVLAQKLIARFPTKRIVLMTPTQCRYPNRFTNTYGLINNQNLTTGDYATAVLNIGKKYGFPVVDMNANCGWNDYNISNFVDDESGVFLHPNITGSKRMAEVAIGKLQEINPIA